VILARFAIICVLTFLLGHSMTALFYSQWLAAIVTLPGTFLHEGAHYLVSALLDGRPEGFSVWPTFDANGNMDTLGHIYSHDNWYNDAAVGTAPLLLMPGTFALCALAARTLNPLKIALFSWFAACAWLSSTPSPQDLSIHYPQSWFVAIPFLLVVTYLTYRWTRALLKV